MNWPSFKTSCLFLLSALTLFFFFFCFPPPSAKLISFQIYAALWHHSHLLYICLPYFNSSKWPPTEITLLEVSDCIFKLPLIDWPLALLACVRCFAATLAPPPLPVDHIFIRAPGQQPADSLIHAINYVSSLLWEFWLRIFSNSTSFFFPLRHWLFFVRASSHIISLC